MLFLMWLFVPLAAVTGLASDSFGVEESTFLADDVIETRTDTGDRRWLKTWTRATTPRTFIAETPTMSVADGHWSAPITLPDDDSETQSDQPLDDRLSEVDEGRHLMDRFYQRYNTTAQVDLVFVLDRSGSVPQKGWHSVVEFVKVGSTVHDISDTSSTSNRY